MVECSGVCGEWYHIKCVTTTHLQEQELALQELYYTYINYLFAMYSRY